MAADWLKKDKDKVIHVNTSALVGLKAALFSKQKDFSREKKVVIGNELGKTRHVSEKTSAIWKKVEPPGRRGKVPRKIGSTAQQEAREERTVSHEEEEALERSRRALEAKSALYDKLSKGEGLKELEEEEETGMGEGQQKYMVDFTRKIVESQVNGTRNSQPSSSSSGGAASCEKSSVADPAARPTLGKEVSEDGDWVEYVDSLGRSRRCLREDLDEMKRRDRDLREWTPPRSDDNSRSEYSLEERSDIEGRGGIDDDEGVARAESEEGPMESLHYQNVQGGEVRNHGVGYFAFSTDTEKRKEQMELLDNLREKTFAQREKRQQLQEKKKALLKARLAKVKQRKMKKLQEQGKPVGELDEEGQLEDGGAAAEDLANFNFEKKAGDKIEEKVVENDSGGSTELNALLAAEFQRSKEKADRDEMERKEKSRAAHVRPWDRGKVFDPIKKRKLELEDERLNEFAPPSSYTKSGGCLRQPFVRASTQIPMDATPTPSSGQKSPSPTTPELDPPDHSETPSDGHQSIHQPTTGFSSSPMSHILPPPPPISAHPLYPTMQPFNMSAVPTAMPYPMTPVMVPAMPPYMVPLLPPGVMPPPPYLPAGYVVPPPTSEPPGAQNSTFNTPHS